MAGLQRSNETFRRSGSSGLVWEDRLLTDDQQKAKTEEFRNMKQSYSVGSVGMLSQRHSTGGGRTSGGGGGGGGGGGASKQGYKATTYVEPAVDPPSPKISGCGFCGAFGKSAAPGNKKKRSSRR